jgi:hypothetical protein
MPGGLGLCLLTLAAFSALLLALFRATAEAPALNGNQALLPAAQGRDLGLLSGFNAYTYCQGGGDGVPIKLQANTYDKVWSCPRPTGGFSSSTEVQLVADFGYCECSRSCLAVCRRGARELSLTYPSRSRQLFPHTPHPAQTLALATTRCLYTLPMALTAAKTPPPAPSRPTDRGSE